MGSIKFLTICAANSGDISSIVIC